MFSFARHQWSFFGGQFSHLWEPRDVPHGFGFKTLDAKISGNVLGQEPMTRSLQLYCVRVTAFSQTDLFLD